MKVAVAALLTVVIALPATAGVIQISIDVNRGVAYIPAGTVLPAGMTVHAAPAAGRRVLLPEPLAIGEIDRSAIHNGARLGAERPRGRFARSAPLRIEVGDESRFAALRAHFTELAKGEGRSRLQSDSQQCSYIYYEASDSGYTAYFTSTFCYDNPGPSVGNYGTWLFGSETNMGGDAEAYVSDDNDNYDCRHLVVGYGGASCSDSAYTQLHSSGGGCRNNVVTGGTVTYWVDISEYEIQFIPISASIEYCTFFD